MTHAVVTQILGTLETPEGFKVWLREQDPDEPVGYQRPDLCPIARYLQDAVGLNKVYVCGRGIIVRHGRHEEVILPPQWVREFLKILSSTHQYLEQPVYALGALTALAKIQGR
jgi:hypothetical protein